ncbi:MAG TPA: aldehyde dehydrogenase [Pseudogracilibacillus sp.]|nr:aldehyde dehydrogenase [Pseudogracilibacillus sp.]
MKKLIESQKQFFLTGETKSYDFRKKQLKRFKTMLTDYEEDIYTALRKDLNKSEHETLTTELGIIYTEISFALRHLNEWMKPETTKTPITHKGTTNMIYHEPYGTVLVIAPWNYPLQLALVPIIGAIAAGNTVVVKPSEHAPHTSRLIQNMITAHFPSEYITVIEGAKETSEALLEERFDYIFFTGSSTIGKIVMKKASKHLTPVTLELGGKSPAIIDEDAQIKLAAKRIVWGKFTNAGQTCVAPDYLYVHHKVYEKFKRRIKKEITNLYGKKPLKNKNYVRIIHKNHFDRLAALKQDGTISFGGEEDQQSLKMAPTVIENVTWNDSIMQEEIFGPLLPVLPFSDIDQVLEKVQQNEKPLALYYFTSSKKKEDKVIHSVSFGGGCMNDTLYHLANPHLPFGGVGQSGMGAYHGKASFDLFSHQKSILKQTNAFDIPVRYPGSRINFNIAKKLFK